MSSNIRINKVCQYCENEFIAKTTVTKFCSDDCAKKAYKKRIREEKLQKAVNPSSFDLPSNISNVKDKEFLNIKEASILLGSSRWTIHRLIKSGQLQAVKLRSKTIIPRKSIDKLFNPKPNESHIKAKKEGQ